MFWAVSIILIGFGFLLSAWALPMVSDHLPWRLHAAIFAGGSFLVFSGALLGLKVR